MDGKTQGFTACLLPIVHPGALCFPGHPCDVEENVIQSDQAPSSIAPMSSSDAHVPTLSAF